jgi:hypothetical protein
MPCPHHQGFLKVLSDNFDSHQFAHFHRKERKERQEKEKSFAPFAGFAVHLFGISIKFADFKKAVGPHMLSLYFEKALIYNKGIDTREKLTIITIYPLELMLTK